jgi:hypothetical protein
MLIKVCPTCKGDGFWRRRRKDTHPMTNIATARLICAKVTPSGDHLYDYARSIVGYEWDCYRCNKSGELQWKRSSSLTPIIP